MSVIPIGNGKIIPIQVTPISAVSTDVGMYITYIGSEASGKVAVAAATGDLTLTHGDVGSEAADDDIDTGGDDAGEIDVSDSGYTTFGGVVDYINRSTNWRARLGSVQRTDLTANTLITLSATQAKGVELGLLRDTTVILTASVYAIGVRLAKRNLFGANNGGVITCLTRVEGIGTSAGTHALKVYSCNPITKVESLVWQGPVATATAYEFNETDFGYAPVMSKPGEELLIQHQADTATITSPRMVVSGGYIELGNTAMARSGAISGQVPA